MRSFHKFPPEIWRDPRFRKLKREAQLIYLYVLSGPHQMSSGLAYLPASYIASDLSFDEDAVELIINELLEQGLVAVNSTHNLVYTMGWFGSNGPQNEKHHKGILKELDRHPSCDLVNMARSDAEAAEERRKEKAKSLRNAKEHEEAAKASSYLLKTTYLKSGSRFANGH